MKPAPGRSTPFTASVVLSAGLLMFATMGLLAYVWASASPVLGRVYTAIRIAESAGLWLFTGWGQYFTSVPNGAPFSFVSIFKSSVPFGVAASLAVAAIGYAAYRKRKTKHLDAVLAVPDGGFTTTTILRDLMPAMPHLAPPPSPPTAEGVATIASKPSPNPFSTVRDLRDGQTVHAVQMSLSWQEAATFALLIDAIAPVSDRTRQEALRQAVWKAARHATSALGKPNNRNDAAIHDALTQAVCDLRERDMPALERAHEAAAVAGTAYDAIAALASSAQTVGRLRLPEFAWLRHLDPLLHEHVVTVE